MKKIGILYHPLKEDARSLSDKLNNFLSTKGVSIWVCSAWEPEATKNQINGTELILTIGGDGTILRAVQIVAPEPIPITGINLGNLGFMTELSADETEEKLTALLAGEGWIDERYLLEAELSQEDAEVKESQKFYALNDVVLARGVMARVIYIEAGIDGETLTNYKADGVIVATATGSTGYALAAGGPVLHPQSRELILLPITPHLSSDYTLVLPESAEVKLNITTFHGATLSIDGHINISLAGKADVKVKHSNHTVRFLRIHPETSFYGSIEQKLKG